MLKTWSDFQSEKEKEVIFATSACQKIFSGMMERGDLYVGQLPTEDEIVEGKRSVLEKHSHRLSGSREAPGLILVSYRISPTVCGTS